MLFKANVISWLGGKDLVQERKTIVANVKAQLNGV